MKGTSERSHMDDLRTRAQLVAFDPAFAAAGAIGTVVTRAEIAETATGGEFPATLLLDIDRVEKPDGDEVLAHARVAVDWDKESLEQLLASTDDEEIALWFDERELAQAFDDVEAQGLRQRAAILAIAVTAAGASTTPALAGHVVGDLHNTQPPAIGVTHQVGGQSPAAQPMGAERGEGLNREISGQPSRGTSGGAPSTQPLYPTSPVGIGAVVGVGAILIAAAGFGATRRRTPPAQPA
jgi:hypothetical protein